jgi:tripartite-type tricarboxylate transporter receptor subunit TctC
MFSNRARAAFVATIAALVGALPASAQGEPFYKGKRLSVLINYGAGGPADIEGRLFARHIGRHIDGNPSIIVQNVDGAGGLIGATYLGEIAPKDGTMMGHLTGVAWRWAFDPERFRVDFGTYEFLGYQTSTTVAFVRTDVPPGIKVPADISKVQSLISGGLGPDNAKDLAIRLALDMLGIPYRHVTSYRSSAHARLALQQGEIIFFSESPPSYRAVVHTGIVKEGLAIPVWHEAEGDGIAAKPVAELPIAPFDVVFKAVKGRPPSGELWDAFRTVRTISSTMIRILALPPGAPRPAVDALRDALVRMNSDPVYAADAIKTIGFVPEYVAGPNTNHEVRTALTVPPQMRAFLAEYVKKANR